MFIVTAKLSRRKVLLGLAAVCAVVLGGRLAVQMAADLPSDEPAAVQTSAEAAESAEQKNTAQDESAGGEETEQTPVTAEVKTNEQRIAYLAQCGWEVDENSCVVQEVIIPSEFSGNYQAYAELQARQGFDLEALKGKRVKQVTYTVTNWTDPNEGVVANLLIYKNRVVAGDITSMSADGFTRALTGGTSDDAKSE
ncbi:MAG: DUF4830 domain-containing protein [Butyricicoccaceae bacterium]